MKSEDTNIKSKEELKEQAEEHVGVLKSFLPLFTKENDPTGWLSHETKVLANSVNFMGKNVTDDVTLRYKTQMKIFEANVWLMALTWRANE